MCMEKLKNSRKKQDEKTIIQKRLRKVTKETLLKENDMLKMGKVHFEFSYQEATRCKEAILESLLKIEETSYLNDSSNYGIVWQYMKQKKAELESLYKRLDFQE